MNQSPVRDHSGTPTWRECGIVWITLFVGIIVVRFDTLGLPAYWDHAMGIWPEGAEIAAKRFNLYQHWFHERHAILGGTVYYRFSLLSVLAGALETLASSPQQTYLAYRLIEYAVAATTGVLTYSLIRQLAGILHAALLLACLFTFPVFSTQLDMLGMEFFMGFPLIAAMWAISRNSTFVAVLIANLGFFVKPTGIGYAVAAAGLFAMQYVAERFWRVRPAIAGWQVIICLAVVASELFAYLLLEGPAIRFAAEPRWIALILPIVWCPEFVAMTALSFLVHGVSSLRSVQRRRAAAAVDPTTDDATSSEDRQPAGEFWPDGTHWALVYCYTWFAAACVIGQPVPIPRYLTGLAPLIYVAFAWAAARFPLSPQTLTTAYCLMLAFNLANWNGRLYPSVATVYRVEFGDSLAVGRREGSLLERSRAYLHDHLANIEALRALEQSLRPNDLVFSGLPFTQMLSYPQIGYIHQPVSGFLVVGPCRYLGQFADVLTARSRAPSRVILIYSENPFHSFLARFHIPPPRPDDEIIYHDGAESPLVVYARRFENAEQYTAWFDEHLASDPMAATAGVSR